MVSAVASTAPWPGRVVKQHGAPGDIVAIGAPLVDLETDAAPVDAGTVVGTLPETTAAVAQPTSDREARPARQAKASPAVRKRAGELGIDIANLVGAGPGGIVTLDDVQAAARRATASTAYEPLRSVRRAMADTMARAGAEIVPATVTDEAIVEAWPADTDTTIRVVRAVVAGCRATPALNAWFDGARKARRLHDRIDLGIAMETDDGLFAPVLRDVGGQRAQREEDLLVVLVVGAQLEAITLRHLQRQLEDVDRVEAQALAVQRRRRVDLRRRQLQVERLHDHAGQFALERRGVA